MPIIFTIVLNGHKKFKTYPNNVKPSRGVILFNIVVRKNIKLGILQISQKTFSK
jgi:hypothetical protein